MEKVSLFPVSLPTGNSCYSPYRATGTSLSGIKTLIYIFWSYMISWTGGRNPYLPVVIGTVWRHFRSRRYRRNKVLLIINRSNLGNIHKVKRTWIIQAKRSYLFFCSYCAPAFWGNCIINWEQIVANPPIVLSIFNTYSLLNRKICCCSR